VALFAADGFAAACVRPPNSAIADSAGHVPQRELRRNLDDEPDLDRNPEGKTMVPIAARTWTLRSPNTVPSSSEARIGQFGVVAFRESRLATC
jgi:hypothetical protein